MSKLSEVPGTLKSQTIVEGPWTSDDIKLIRSTVARGATEEEFKLFLMRCKLMGLNPLKPGQIYFIKYGNSPGTIVIGIEGFRARAQSTGKLSGISRGVVRNEKGECIGAWAEIHRSDWTHPAREEVSLKEYTTGRGNWVEMPETMIKKVAEAAALRMAFPDDLGGIYTKEEMDQAVIKSSRVAPQQPESGDGDTSKDGYRFPVGQFKGRTLEEVDLDKLRKWVQVLDQREKDAGKTLSGDWAEAREIAVNYIAAFENGSLENQDEVSE